MVWPGHLLQNPGSPDVHRRLLTKDWIFRTRPSTPLNNGLEPVGHVVRSESENRVSTRQRERPPGLRRLHIASSPIGAPYEHRQLLVIEPCLSHRSPRWAHDLIIAAHAAETGRMILSRDAKARFGELPGVSAINV